jgi:predicted RNA-binding protein Jag
MEHTLLPFVTDFFTKLGISIEHLSINQEKEDINIVVKTPDSALLIGMHGKNIEVFQHLLSRMIERQLHQFVHVHLEVNDYIKQKEEKLYRFLDSKIPLIMSHGKPIHIPNLSSFDRKKAHNYIATKEIPGIKTHSEGE